VNECFAPFYLLLGLAAPDRLGLMCRAAQAAAAETNDVSLSAYAAVFLLNCLLEAPAYWLAGRKLGRSHREIAGQVVLLNLATHPLVYYGFPHVASTAEWSWLTMVTLCEIFAFTMEAVLLRIVWRYSWPMAIFASTAANFTSWQTGALLYDAGMDELLQT
jgi:hypothetical protein